MLLLKSIKMKKNNYFIVVTILLGSICCAPVVNAGIISGLLKVCGVKDDSPVMEIAKTVDGAGNAYVAKQVDNAMNEYGGEEYKNNPEVRDGVLELIGVSSRDLDNANAWNESDKYGKQHIVVNEVIDVVGQCSSDPELWELMKRLHDANYNYHFNEENPWGIREVRDESNPEVVTSRTLDALDIFYDAYQIHDSRKKEMNRQIMGIAEQLVATGRYEFNATTLEIAGTILSIQKDESLTDSEKIEWLSDMGFYGHETEILEIAEQINETAVDELIAQDVNVGPTLEELEEAKRREREEKERVEKEIKSKAILLINQTIVDGYAINEKDINDVQKLSLDSIATIMTDYDDLNVTIYGHTCNIGSDTANYNVGLKRAEAAKAYLIERGIDAEKIVTESLGETDPIVENTNLNNRLKNRRITFVVK